MVIQINIAKEKINSRDQSEWKWGGRKADYEKEYGGIHDLTLDFKVLWY